MSLRASSAIRWETERTNLDLLRPLGAPTAAFAPRACQKTDCGNANANATVVATWSSLADAAEANNKVAAYANAPHAHMTVQVTDDDELDNVQDEMR